MTALGAHFGNLHKKVTFNDNCDGTLTVLGPSREKSQSGFYSGIVVSQNPLPPDAPPPAEPSQPPWQLQVAKIDRTPIPALPGSSSLPTLSTPALRSQDSVGSESSPAATTPTWAALGVSPPPPTIPRRGGARYVIGASGITRPPSPPRETAAGYLAGLLHKDSLVPNRADIKFFNRCVFRRKLPASWIEHHGGTMLAAPFYASAMAYMVGNYVGGRQACKKKKTSTRRLSDMCIRLPGGMPLEAKMAFSKTETCVGCHYYANLHRQRNACDWNPDADRGSSVEHSADAEQQPPPPVVVSTSTNTNTNGQGRKHRLSTAEAALEELPRAKVARTNVSPEMRDSEQQSLDMEDWEFAPGRVVDEESNESTCHDPPFHTVSPFSLRPNPSISQDNPEQAANITTHRRHHLLHALPLQRPARHRRHRRGRQHPSRQARHQGALGERKGAAPLLHGLAGQSQGADRHDDGARRARRTVRGAARQGVRRGESAVWRRGDLLHDA